MPDGFDQWLRERHRSVTIFILLAAALVRLIYFLQLAPTPLIGMHRLPPVDMNYFDSWAKRIAHGDVLSRQIESPLHTWHAEIAQQFAERYPERVRALGLSTDLNQDELARKLWNHWCPPGRFYQEPLYPYLVGFVYTICGESPQAVFVLQLAIGCAGCWLIFAIGTHAFGETCGLVAAFAAILCPQMLLYEMVLHRTSLITVFGLLLCWQLQRANSGRRWFWTGISCGISLMLQSQFAVMAVASVATIFVIGRSDWRRVTTWCGLFLIGVALAQLPLMARNYRVGAPPLAPPGGGYLTFIGANTEDYIGRGVAMSLTYAPDLIDRSQGSLLKAMRLTYQSHPRSSTLLRNFADKFAFIWHWYEVPNNENFYCFQLYAAVLSWLPITFALIAPLGIVGMALGLGRMRVAWPLYALFGTHFLVQMLFFAIARYRAPMTVTLIPFAAWTIVSVARRVRAAQWAFAGGIATAVLALAAVVSRPQTNPLPMIFALDAQGLYEFVTIPPLNDALQKHDYPTAVQLYEQFISVVPEEVKRLERGLRPAHPNDLELAAFYHDVFLEGQQLMTLAGRPDRANELSQQAHRLDIALHRFGDRPN